MSTLVQFIERETGERVSVETVFKWEPYPRMSIITYSSGRRYAMPDDELTKHFDIVTPQEVMIDRAYVDHERPTPKQREL